MIKRKLIKIIFFFFYLLIVWGGYRFLTDFREIVDELVFKPLIWLAPVFFLVKKVEKRKFISLGLVFDKPFRKILLGFSVSTFILAEYLLALFIKGKQISFNPQNLAIYAWLIYGLSCLGTGIIEEIVFRGFLMTRLNEIIKDKLYSNIIVGLLFFVIHLPILVLVQNQDIGGIGEFFVLSVSLGLIDGYIFWKTKGVLAPIAAHVSLNFLSLVVG